MQSIKGTVKRVIFNNPDNGFTVCGFLLQGRLTEVVIAGNLFEIRTGEDLEVEGTWEKTKRGDQFAVQTYRHLLPTTEAGIRKYLASGVIPGVRAKTAERIIKKFGADTIAILDEAPSRIAEVPGLGRARAKIIVNAWESKRGLRNLSVFLQGVGVPGSLAPKIMKRFGANAVKMVKESPYELALEVTGIGFATADKIAKALGTDQDSPVRAAAGIVHTLNELAEDGHSGYPLSLLIERSAALLETDEEIVRGALPLLVERHIAVIDRKDPSRDAYVFLAPLFEAETAVGAAMRLLEAGTSRLRGFDGKKAVDWLSKKRGINLTPLQAEAVIAACTEKILVITGGPGTGKTTIVKAIVDVLDVLKGEALLAAPTGRAAKRLAETTGREAKTIHRLLELRPGTERYIRSRIHLDPDVLIIDEASMMDLNMTAAVATSLASHTHLVLVGDVDQLPSVGAGDVLADFINCGKYRVVRLTEIFRQDESGLIVENAHRILAGKDLKLPGEGEKSDFYFIERDNPAGVLNTVVDVMTRRLPDRFGFDPMSDILVVSPMHRGETGVKSLNDALQKALNPDGPAIERGDRIFRLGDRVLQTSNDYDRDIYNGDMGRIVHVDIAGHRLVVDFDGRRVNVEGTNFEDLVPAYAISIHKAQGSEHPAVIVVLSTQHFIMLQRNILYTAITRGKRMVVIVGSRRAIRRSIDNSQKGKRYGLLRERL